MKTIIISFLALVTIFIFSCNLIEVEPVIYKQRREDHKFIRCKFNGEEWSYSYERFSLGLFGPAKTYLRTTYFDKENDKDYLNIYAVRDNDDNTYEQEIDLSYEDELRLGINELKDTVNSIVDIDKNRSISHYYLDPDFSNIIIIKDIDKENKILKGDFQFRAVTKDKRDTVRVIDGEFDLEIKYWRPKDHYEFRCYLNEVPFEINKYFKSWKGPMNSYFDKRTKTVDLRVYQDDYIFKFNFEEGVDSANIIVNNMGDPIITKGNYSKYYLDSTYNNKVFIDRIDTIEKYIKGSFDFRAINSVLDTIYCKEGYFESEI